MDRGLRGARARELPQTRRDGFNTARRVVADKPSDRRREPNQRGRGEQLPPGVADEGEGDPGGRVQPHDTAYPRHVIARPPLQQTRVRYPPGKTGEVAADRVGSDFGGRINDDVSEVSGGRRARLVDRAAGRRRLGTVGMSDIKHTL